MPLSSEDQLKGKPAIDGVCSRLGKSGGSLIHQGLLLSFATITASAPYVAGFLLTTIGIWIVAAKLLGKQFNALTAPSVALKETAVVYGSEKNQSSVSSEPIAVK